MSKKILLSKSGVNALTATNPNDFIFHSDYNTFKIISSGTIQQSISSGTQNLSLAHGLGYIPLVLGFLKVDSLDEALSPSWMFFHTSPYTSVSLNRVSADATNAYFRVQNLFGTLTANIKYYIFEVPL